MVLLFGSCCASDQRSSGLVVLLFVSRADARDTGAEGHDKRRREGMSGEEAKGGHEWRGGGGRA